MKSTKYFAGIAVLVMISVGALSFHSTSTGAEKSSRHTNAASAQRPEAAKLEVMKAYGKLPLRFEANQGQTDSQVKFLSHGNGYALFLTPTEAVLALRESAPSGESDPEALREMRKTILPEKTMHGGRPLPDGKSTVLRMQLVGANPAPQVLGRGELPGKSNYFIGNDATKWRTNVANYAKVEYTEIYPGVDLVYYGNQSQLEHDFILAPGADPSTITMELKGADKPSIDSQGDLIWATAGGEVRLQKPVVYQEVDGSRREIAGSYVLKGKHRVGVELGAYDASSRLVIDPVLSYSTYLGGIDTDDGSGIAVDSSGNAYVTGLTRSTNFPTTTGAFQTTYSGNDNAFVTKLNPTGSALVYSTYLGGGGGAYSFSIAADSSGNAYVTGLAGANFPITAGAFQTTPGSDNLGPFVTKLGPTGSALVYSTYLSGSDFDEIFAIGADSSGNAYVTGFTTSTNFPTTVGAFQTTFGGGIQDAFVTKLNPTGSALIYSTYLGGSVNVDEGCGIAVDSSGNAYVTGVTLSTNFPTTTGALQTTFGGGNGDAFVTKLNPAGSTLVYSTYLGGSGGEAGFSIAVDSSGNAYVTGRTDSINFPATAGAFQTTPGGGIYDAFMTMLDPTGSALVYSTYLGGSGDDEGLGIAVDSFGNAYATGDTSSTNFPTTTGAFQTTFGGGFYGDAFVARLDPTGSALAYSTYLGGSSDDGGAGIGMDSSGNAYVIGYTSSTNFPTTTGAFQTTFGGVDDAFVSKIGGETLTITSANTTTFIVGTAGSFSVTATGSPTPALSELGALPSGVIFSDSGNGTGTLSGIPAAGTDGTYNISFVASNGVGSDAVQSFALKVIALQSIGVTPLNPSLSIGSSLQFKATGTYTDTSTRDITASVIWNSSKPNFTTITTTGFATAVQKGSTTISATSGAISGSTVLTVPTSPSIVLLSIAITPANPSINVGTTLQFIATGTYSDNSTQDLTGSVAWTSSTKKVATISTGGLATAVRAGNATIKAKLGAITDTTTLSVIP